MSFFKGSYLFATINKKLLSLVIMMAISICVLQIDTLANLIPSKSFTSVNENTTSTSNPHTPEICHLASQKYTNQTKDLLIPSIQETIVFYDSPHVVLDARTFHIFWSSKIYIQNLTLIV